MKRLWIKRVYETPSADDGLRILVDRLWPRGIRKEEARIDEWMKTLGPSTELRRWYAHEPQRWEEFARRYIAELRDKPEEVRALRDRLRDGHVTLLYAARDTARNNAVVLQRFLSMEPESRATASRSRSSASTGSTD